MQGCGGILHTMDTPLPTKRFQRQSEDFTCLACGAEVVGTGFTNHCPHCLYSQHVDVQPGDRAESCGGLMEPTGIEPFGGSWKILQRCQTCGFTRKNKVVADDDFQAVLALQEKANHKRFYTSGK